MKTSGIILICLAAVFFSTVNPLYAYPEDSYILLEDDREEYTPGFYLYIFEDDSAALTIGDIVSGGYDNEFIRSDRAAPNYGFIDPVVWVRFTLKNPLDEPRELYLEHKFPPMDFINLYYEKNGKWHLKTAGDSVSYDERDILYRNVVFSLNVEPRSSRTYYMRFDSSSSMNLDMSLWDHDRFLEKVNTEQYYLGLYYGIMFVMVVYNLFVFLSIRERTYIFYVAFIGFYVIFQFSLNGLGYKFFDGELLLRFNNNIPLFMAFTTTFGLLFTRYFLHSEETTPVFDKYMKVLLVLNGACILFALYADYNISIQVTTFLVTVTIVSMTINGFLSLISGYRPARFYVMGWTAFLVGGLFQTFKAFGFVGVNFFTVWSQQIGSAIEVTLLSLALADRINIIEKEKSEARETLIKVQKDYSSELEKTVYERTRDLQSERNVLKDKNDQMKRDIALAKKIQKQIIPSGDPAPFIASLYKPMDEIGGDYYDFIMFDDPAKTGIFLSDVTGHGVPAAFITSMIKTIILQADEYKHDPAMLIKHINGILNQQIAGNFVTIFYCIYDSSSRSLLFANAGHNPPYLITSHSVSYLEGTSSCIPIGIMTCEELKAYEKEYANSEVTLEPGSRLLLYTDGLTESRNSDNPYLFFEHAGFAEFLLKNFHLSCKEYVNELYSELKRFKKNEPLDDDVCVICLEIK